MYFFFTDIPPTNSPTKSNVLKDSGYSVIFAPITIVVSILGIVIAIKYRKRRRRRRGFEEEIELMTWTLIKGSSYTVLDDNFALSNFLNIVASHNSFPSLDNYLTSSALYLSTNIGIENYICCFFGIKTSCWTQKGWEGCCWIGDHNPDTRVVNLLCGGCVLEVVGSGVEVLVG